MARRSLPANLALRLPAYHIVIYEGVPMFRAQAWALYDYKVHGGRGTVNSAIRRDSTVRNWRGRGLRKGYQSQFELYNGFRGHVPGYFPANPPGYSAHEGFADGIATYHTHEGRVARRGQGIARWEWGIDFVDAPGGSAEKVVAWLNAHGYKAERPYGTNSERHHFCFRRSPATRARMRLARWVATGK